MSFRPRVVIVEDEPDTLLLLRINLDAAGFEASLAADGATAMRRITAERPDVVLLDLMLPVLDGWAVLAELHRVSQRAACDRLVERKGSHATSCVPRSSAR